MKLLSKMGSLTAIALSGCQASGGNTAAGVAGVPPAAVTACSRQADDYWNAAPGTSFVNGAQMSTAENSANWQLQIGTGNQQTTCTVNPIGNIINFGAG